MSIIISTDFESGVSGNSLTLANVPADSITPTPRTSVTHPMHGTKCMSVLRGAAGSFTWRSGSGTKLGTTPPSGHAGRFYLNVAGTESGATVVVLASSVPGLSVADGNVLTWRVGSTAQGTLLSALTADTWYRVEWLHDNTALTIQVKVYLGDAATPLVDTGLVGVGSAISLTSFVLGVPSTTSSTAFSYDDAAIGDQAGGFLGPAVPPGTGSGLLPVAAALTAAGQLSPPQQFKVTASATAAGGVGLAGSASLAVTVTAAGSRGVFGAAQLILSASPATRFALSAATGRAAGAWFVNLSAAGSAAVPPLPGPPSLFTPPSRTQWNRIRGSLGFSFEVSSTVWKDDLGVWHAAETPSSESLVDALIVLAGRPQIVPQSVADELVAAGIGTIRTFSP